ncbi:MAG: hypothetical protein ABI193_06310 [Minicystis sp.]
MSTAGTRWTMLGAAAALALLSGCGEYTSGYRPPQDARARVLWNGNGVFAAVPQGVVTAECMRAMDEAQERPTAYFQGYSGSRGGVRVFWTPGIYVGPPVIVHHHGGGAPFPTRRLATPTSGGSSNSIFGSSGGSGGGGDGGKAIAVVAAVVVLLALPVVTLGLAAGRPEPEKSVALAIDEVNAYNDLARYPGTPCSPEGMGAPQ